MPESAPEPVKVDVTWEDLDRLVAELAERLAAAPAPDVVLAISRGGLVPAGMLGYRMGWRDMLLAAVVAYDDESGFRGSAEFLQFPADEQLAGMLDVFLVGLKSEQVINWAEDEAGRLTRVMVKDRRTVWEGPTPGT